MVPGWCFRSDTISMTCSGWSMVVPPVDHEIDDYVAPWSEQRHQASGSHWLNFVSSKHLDRFDLHGLGLAELCTCFETVELWIDPTVNDQLELIWLLDYLRRQNAVPACLLLRPTAAYIGTASVPELVALTPPTIAITGYAVRTRRPEPGRPIARRHLRTGRICSREDLGPLPQLRNAVLKLLAELPAVGTGLGATEMGLLELIYPEPPRRISVIINTMVFFNGLLRSVFNYSETAALLEPLTLARCRRSQDLIRNCRRSRRAMTVDATNCTRQAARF